MRRDDFPTALGLFRYNGGPLLIIAVDEKHVYSLQNGELSDCGGPYAFDIPTTIDTLTPEELGTVMELFLEYQ